MSTSTITPDVQMTAKKWGKQRGALIMALHEIQERYGYVPRHVALQIAQLMEIPMARIYEVLTFYNFFKLEAPGKYTVSVCMGTACYLKGAPDLVGAFKDQLGIEEGESTADGLFHLQAVRCVGCCGLAPVVTVNGETYSKVETKDVTQIIAKLREEG